MRDAKTILTIIRNKNLLRSKRLLESPGDIERVMPGSERGCWKSVADELSDNSLATHSTFTEEALRRVLQGFCMNQLYPYVCAEVNRLVTQGGFSPVYLNPIDFDAEQQKAALQPEPEVKKNPIKV